ncbi:DUF3892 domain-containing protein [Mucilaginibacter sp. E4BP6]|uniref:DUF3892 domain-containing protein n=1 Tax=Mucilaginibacter sp. E4BP6 TaxID=2723089 RepID=UPI0015C69FF8|nr:DUF3892 domain-containing protein [Mucilaginibacter sp. E4BP6]NYE64890.1 hypothetical protein [Mucilaginibacter sp. E4BP6]
MASRRKVSCINKRGGDHEAHERISHIGGINADGNRWREHEDDAIAGIENKTKEFYVSVGGKNVEIIVAKHNGRKYLKTEADGYSPDNLLSLPECP